MRRGALLGILVLGLSSLGCSSQGTIKTQRGASNEPGARQDVTLDELQDSVRSAATKSLGDDPRIQDLLARPGATSAKIGEALGTLEALSWRVDGTAYAALVSSLLTSQDTTLESLDDQLIGMEALLAASAASNELAEVSKATATGTAAITAAMSAHAASGDTATLLALIETTLAAVKPQASALIETAPITFAILLAGSAAAASGPDSIAAVNEVLAAYGEPRRSAKSGLELIALIINSSARQAKKAKALGVDEALLAKSLAAMMRTVGNAGAGMVQIAVFLSEGIVGSLLEARAGEAALAAAAADLVRLVRAFDAAAAAAREVEQSPQERGLTAKHLGMINLLMPSIALKDLSEISKAMSDLAVALQSGRPGGGDVVAMLDEVYHLLKRKSDAVKGDVYRVVYHGNGQTSGTAPMDPKSYLPGTQVTVLEAGTLERQGHTFAGWNHQADGGGATRAAASTFDMPANDVALYALWTPLATYSVHYDGNGHSAGQAPSDSNAYLPGSVATVAAAGSMAKSGHTFAGWNTLADASGDAYLVGAALTVGNGELTLYAVWTADPTYAVIYDGNAHTSGVVAVDPNNYQSGSPVTVAGAGSLARTGYTFVGWNTQPDGSGVTRTGGTTFAMGSSDVILYALWSADPTYTVVYDGNLHTGGTAPVDGNRYLTGASVTAAPAGTLSRFGHAFIGWNTAADGSGTMHMPAATFVMGIADLTLYALWNADPTYTVAYDGNGSSGGAAPIDGNNYLQGASVTIAGAGTLTRTGYSFDGWNTAADGSGTTHMPAATFAMGIANLTLYAQWHADPTYSVHYDGNGSSSGTAPTDNNNYLQGVSVTVASAGTLMRTGYSFGGWNTAADGGGTDYAASSIMLMGTASVTLYAQWDAEVTAYKVAYNGNGHDSGTIPVDTNGYAPGDSVSVSGISFSRSGHMFTNWNTAADGSGTTYWTGDTLTMGSADVTLYAQWFAFYVVSYSGNGADSGTPPTDYGTYQSGDSVLVLDGSSLGRSGYVFTGWNTAADGSGTGYMPTDYMTMSAANRTLYAVWAPTHNITYDGNGHDSGTVPVDTTDYAPGASVQVSGISFSRSGHMFLNWNTAVDGTGTTYWTGDTLIMGSTDVKLYAQWWAFYLVSYDANGPASGYPPTDYGTYSQGDGVSVADANTLSLDGHIFRGWNTSANGSGTSYAPYSMLPMGSSNVTLYAQWEPYYYVHYDGNGDESGWSPNSTFHLEGDQVQLQSRGSLYRSGYEFAGWNTAVNGSGASYAEYQMIYMGHGDLTLYAQWTFIPVYTVTYDGNGADAGTPPVDPTGHPEGSAATVLDGWGISRTGYVFVGWNTAADGSGSDYPAYSSVPIGTSNVVLYAKWEVMN